MFKEERSFKHLITKALARINDRILSNVAKEYYNLLTNKLIPYAKLVRLKQEF